MSVPVKIPILKRLYNLGENLPCKICGKMYSCRKNLKRHVQDVHLKAREVKCYICDYVSINAAHLRRHTKVMHEAKRCKICNKKFSAISLKPEKHEAICEAERNIKCNKCDLLFKDNPTLKLHMKTHKGSLLERQEMVKCRICQKGFSRLDKRLDHYQNVHFIKLFVCQKGKCGRRFETKEECDGHFDKLHGEKIHKCEPCDKIYPKYQELWRHNKFSHGNSSELRKKNSCTLCNKGFLERKWLMDHIQKTHFKIEEEKDDFLLFWKEYLTSELENDKSMNPRPYSLYGVL